MVIKRREILILGLLNTDPTNHQQKNILCRTLYTEGGKNFVMENNKVLLLVFYGNGIENIKQNLLIILNIFGKSHVHLPYF